MRGRVSIEQKVSLPSRSCQSRPVISLLLASCCLSTFPSDLYKPHLAVVEQRANLDPNGQQIHANMTLQSRLPLGVRGVRLGFLLAESDAALQGVDTDTVYDAPAAPGVPLKAVAYDAPLNLAPQAVITSNLTVPMDAPVTFSPKVFLTHVLAYHLSDVDVTTLLELVNSSASVDQVAACEAFALLGDPNAKAAARQRWSKKDTLRRELTEVLQRPAPAAPEQADTFGRIYAARALGVLGGAEAYEILNNLAQDPNLSQFDAPLQVLQRARQGATPQRVPLAFAIPADATSFAAVVQAALADVGADTAGRFFGWQVGVSTSLMVLFAVATAVAVGLLRRQR